jgi:ABC-type proline/glycine betaine transport system ATPase subunit
MVGTDLIMNFKSGLPDDDIFDSIIAYLENEQYGSEMIPYDDTDEFDNSDFRFKLNSILREHFLLPSYQVASNMVKVNNIMCIYNISAKDAMDHLLSYSKEKRSKND